MRLIKMFGLAAIAVGALMAFVGATRASAITSLEEVVVCKSLEDPCAKENHFLKRTVLHGKTITAPVLLTIGGNVECLESKVLGETSEFELLARGLITSLSWSEHCLRNGSNCIVTTLNLPYLVLALLTEDHKKYQVDVEKHFEGSGRPSAIISCLSFPESTCDFGAGALLFEVLHTGASNAVVLNILQKLIGEGVCIYSSGIWHAEYEVKCLNAEEKEVGCWPAMEAGSKL